MTQSLFPGSRPAPAPSEAVRGAGFSATVDPDGRLRPVELHEVSLVAQARDLIFRDDARLAEALAFAEQCQRGSGPWCRHAEALLQATRSHFGLLAVPARAGETGPGRGDVTSHVGGHRYRPEELPPTNTAGPFRCLLLDLVPRLGQPDEIEGCE